MAGLTLTTKDWIRREDTAGRGVLVVVNKAELYFSGLRG